MCMHVVAEHTVSWHKQGIICDIRCAEMRHNAPGCASMHHDAPLCTKMHHDASQCIMMRQHLLESVTMHH